MESTVGVAGAASAAAVNAGFLAGVGATIMGNLIFIILFFIVCGLFSYSSDHNSIGWSVFWGTVVAVIIAATQAPMMLVWYLVGSLVVMAVQITWFDVRNIERKKANKYGDATFWSYRWFTYNKDKSGEVTLKLDRASMGRYGVGYVSMAPFLVVHWVFGELIRSVVDVFVDMVRNSLMRRLTKVFNVENQITTKL
jgi:hypothetical protein